MGWVGNKISVDIGLEQLKVVGRGKYDVWK